MIKNNNKMKKLLLSSMVSLSLLGSMPSHAFVFSDIGVLIEETVGNAQEAANWIQESELMKLSMEMDSWMQQTEMEMNAFLTQTTLQTELEHTENMHNKMVDEMSEPDDQAGQNCAIQNANSDVACYTVDLVTKAIDKDTYENANFTTTPIQVQQNAFDKRKKIIDDCRSLQYADAPEGQDDLATSLCTRSGILLGVESQDTYTADEQEAVTHIVDLITGPIPDYKKSESLPEGSPEKLALMNKEMRMLAIRSLANSSLEHIAGVRKSAGENASMQVPSELGTLQEFDDKRWGDVDWSLKVGGASKNIEDTDTRSEILRKMAVMQSFQIHLEMIKYKQMLRMEALQAADLSLQVQPLQY
ncbi:hypothetical protein [Vibrio owensii]|uniref:hypothetical protein n=1 Tax=Vibrio harveyi group TaxID=717610 RepID=UPI003CC566E1